MIILKKNIAHLFLIFSALSLTSCALRSIPSDYSSVRLETVDTNTLGNGKVLIYNGASILHSMDNTARLNVWIDDKSIGQIRTKEYLIIDLKNGNYDFKALHIDMVNMRSTHKVEINDNTKVIRIEPTITSNKLTVTNILPENFDKYTYRADRK
ncbi:hypothetical protein [Chryseobacterium polytrichastri]|uniref:DUF2846 domain-containing protein n=1 Tax=Chryseobacterium polytrichastri TaxID=1302687 RepID=A0A1M6PML8_9FLAO|nr:hypothetical protein [Chryseobacterium polytrichastri]SHK09163.1 hypothetical protein SAMN05444267_100155 [Chryseobacterium polytrichastri]